MWSSSKQLDYVEGCETPASPSEFFQVANSTFNELLALESADDWKEFDHGLDPSIRAWEKLSPQNPIPYIKIEGTLPASPLEVETVSWSMHLETRKHFEPDLMHISLIEEVNPNVQVTYQQINTPFPVTSRDVLSLRIKAIEQSNRTVDLQTVDNKDHFVPRVVYGTSVNNSKKPIERKFVRAVGTMGLFLRPIDSNNPFASRAVRIIKVDPKGNIPKFVITLGKKKAVQSFIDLRNYLGKHIVPHRAPLSLTPQQPRHIHDHPAKIARHLSIAEDTFSDSDSDTYFDPIEYDDEAILHGNTPHPSSTFVTPYPTSTIIHVPAPVETINNSVVKDMQLSLSTLQEQIRNIQQKITDIQLLPSGPIVPAIQMSYRIRKIVKWFLIIVVWPILVNLAYKWLHNNRPRGWRLLKIFLTFFSLTRARSGKKDK
jgi:hypothetical protein